MEPMISIIIPEFKDDTYLIRGLNSLKRQTYKSMEIIIADDVRDEKIIENYGVKVVEQGGYWEKLNKAIEMAKGKYIFFYDINSVMPVETLQNLYTNVQSDIFYCVHCVYPIENEFFSIEGEKFRMYGKLFKRAYLRENEIVFKCEEIYPELEFVYSYYRMYNDIFININECMYMNDIQIILNENISVKVLRSFLDKFVNIEHNELEYLLFRILDVCEENEKKNAMLMLAEKKEWNLNYKLANKYLSNIYNMCLNTKDERTFEWIKRYFTVFKEQKYFLKTLLKTINLTEKELDILFDVSLEEYIFLQDKFQDILETERYINVVTQEQSDLDEKLKSIEQKIDNIQIPTQYIEKIVPVEKELSGPVLAEDVIEKYLQGRLGLKTLLKSLIAWIKYKI